MTYKQIEASREIRLWIGQIIVPTAILAGTTILSVPEARHAIADKFVSMKDSIKLKIHTITKKKKKI